MNRSLNNHPYAVVGVCYPEGCMESGSLDCLKRNGAQICSPYLTEAIRLCSTVAITVFEKSSL